VIVPSVSCNFIYNLPSRTTTYKVTNASSPLLVLAKNSLKGYKISVACSPFSSLFNPNLMNKSIVYSKYTPTSMLQNMLRVLLCCSVEESSIYISHENDSLAHFVFLTYEKFFGMYDIEHIKMIPELLSATSCTKHSVHTFENFLILTKCTTVALLILATILAIAFGALASFVRFTALIASSFFGFVPICTNWKRLIQFNLYFWFLFGLH
jgi:hypothetical protein